MWHLSIASAFADGRDSDSDSYSDCDVEAVLALSWA